MAYGQKTGGRARGVPNKATSDRKVYLRHAADIASGALPEAFEGNAHAFLMFVYKNQDAPLELRLDAAKAAIRYESKIEKRLGLVEA